jgi:hypothetical protein
MDVPLLVKYEDLAFTFLIEHNHDPHKFSIHQLSRYTSYLEERHERNVIPIVYFTNASAKNMALKREIKSAFMGKRYHYFTYETVFLKDKPAKKYLKSDNIIARLLLPFMRYSKDDWLEVLDSALKAVWELVAPSEGLRQNKYLDFLAYYFNLRNKTLVFLNLLLGPDIWQCLCPCTSGSLNKYLFPTYKVFGHVFSHIVSSTR